MRRAAVIFALLLAATPLAARTLEVRPIAPTSATPVSIVVIADYGDPCAPSGRAVAITGKRIVVNLGPRATVCPATLAPWSRTIDLGLLPAGEYDLDVLVDDAPQPYVTTKLVVREASQPFRVRPFALPSDSPTIPLRVMLEGVDLQCSSGPPCPNIVVRFGDTPATVQVENGRVWVLAPAHAPGLVDVSVSVAGGPTTVARNAAYFFDRGAAPDFSVWERVLFPVLVTTPGAFGSQWISEAAILNRNSYYVETFNKVDPFQCIDFPCTERYAPGNALRFEGNGHPDGAVLLVPRDAASGFTYSLRVRDRSREEDDFGTQVPVVRESDFHRESFALVDVPLREGFRAKLRIYSLDPMAHNEASVAIEDPLRRTTTIIRVPLRREANDAHAYGEVDLDPKLGIERATVTITPPLYGAPTWAFISLTNNNTQRVTTVFPN